MDGSVFIGTWWSLVPPVLAIVLGFDFGLMKKHEQNAAMRR